MRWEPLVDRLKVTDISFPPIQTPVICSPITRLVISSLPNMTPSLHRLLPALLPLLLLLTAWPSHTHGEICDLDYLDALHERRWTLGDDASWTEHPWNHYSTLRVHRQPDRHVCSNLRREYTTRLVQGMNLTVAEIIARFASHGCHSLIWGGAVRDAVLSRPPADIDLAISCPPQRVAELCRQEFGAANCQHPHPGSQKLMIGRTAAVKRRRDLAPVDVAHWNVSFRVDPTGWEYTADAMAVYLEPSGGGGEGSGKGCVVLDPSGMGYRDACRRVIRIPAAKEQWNEWAEESYPTKILR